MKLKFNNKQERMGAEIIINNVATAFGASGFSVITTETSLEFNNLSESIVSFSQSHEDWQHIESIGKIEELKLFILSIDQRFNKSQDKTNEIALIKSEIQSIIQ